MDKKRRRASAVEKGRKRCSIWARLRVEQDVRAEPDDLMILGVERMFKLISRHFFSKVFDLKHPYSSLPSSGYFDI
jgi:hypothetical protein